MTWIKVNEWPWPLVLWVLVWFLFYGPSTHFRSFRVWLVTLTTLFLGKPLGSLPVLSAHSVPSNWQLLSLNQWKRENGRRNVFMTKSPWKSVPDVGIELGAACMPSGLASDRATAPGPFGTYKASCTHLVECIYQLLYNRLQLFLKKKSIVLPFSHTKA